jgi:hypothetical protein
MIVLSPTVIARISAAATSRRAPARRDNIVIYSVHIAEGAIPDPIMRLSLTGGEPSARGCSRPGAHRQDAASRMKEPGRATDARTLAP